MASAERIRKVEAVIISHRDFGEADRLVKLFSRAEGKLTAIAKGARRIRSRKAAHLEPFTHASLILAVGRTFWIITQADTLTDFPNIRADLQKTARTAYILELTDQLSTEYQADDSMYRLILDTLKRIEKSGDIFNSVCFFELQVLGFSGFRPELFRCVGCGKEIMAEDQFFSVRHGGALCPSCGKTSIEGAFNISMEILRYLRHFQRSVYRQISNLVVPDTVKIEIRRVLDLYIAGVVERRLNSPEFLDQINHHHTGLSE